MRFLSELSYNRMQDKIRVLETQNQELRSALRKSRANYQQLVLLAGLRGLEIDTRPAIPARPERLIMKERNNKSK